MLNIFVKYKIIFYLCNFFLIFLYIFPGSILGWIFYEDLSLQPQITPDLIVSTNHVYAFFILSSIGFLTFKKPNILFLLITYLIFLSILLEITHKVIPERGFEFSDLFGNLIGVIIAIIIKLFFKKYENYKN